MLQRLRIKSVQGNVYALLTIALFSIVGLISSNTLILKQLHTLHTSVSTEFTRLELNDLLHNSLLSLKAELLALSANANSHEIAFHYHNAQRLTHKVEEILHVLDKGGTIKNNYQVNFGNQDEAVLNLTYARPGREKIDLVVIELKSRIEELKGMMVKLEQLIKDRQQAVENNNQGMQHRLEKKIIFFYKGIQPFFGRILENANRISFESSSNLAEADTIRQKSIKRAILLISLLAGGGLLCLFLIGSHLVKNIHRIVAERSNVLSQMEELNEQLEQKVEERTAELQESNKKLQDESEQRQQAQKKIVEQVNFLYETINALSHPFYVVDVRDYSLILYNDAVSLLGDNPINSKCYELTHRSDIPCSSKQHPCPLQEVIKTGKPFTVDHIHYDKDGNEIYVEVHAYPIFDELGNVVQMIEYSLDITDKRLAEQALQKMNEELEHRIKERTAELAEEVQVRRKAEREMEKIARHFRFLIEHAPGVVMIINTGGFIEYTSPSIEYVTGYTADSLLHNSLFTYTHEDDDNQLDFIWKMEPGGHEKIVREFRFRSNKGDWIIVDSVTVNRLDEPSVEGIVINLWDITKRKQLEKRMQWLNQAVEQSPNTVVITDINGTIEYVNRSFVESTGYTAEEAIGENPRVLKSGLTPQSVYEDLWKTILAGRTWTGEFINKKKSGEFYTERVIISPLRNEQGKCTHFLATKENVTELIKARRQAEEANKAKSAFLANMSHEIRTPLNGILGFVDLLAKKERDAGQKKYIDIIKASAGHLQSIIDDILDLSKIESGKLDLDLHETKLRKKIEPTIELFYAKAAEKDIDFYSFIDPSLPGCLSCDILRINQVLANLINNAIKFTPKGGRIDVIVEGQTLEGGKITVKFAVKDSGIGMDEQTQEKIFLSFSQADVSTTRKYGGTGLGLTISKTLVEMMGGQLLLKSKPDHGSTFYFSLDLPVCGDSYPEQEKTACRHQVKSIGILVTEQNDQRDEQHIYNYLHCMEIHTELIPLHGKPEEHDLLIAVANSWTREEVTELYRDHREKIILVIRPEDLEVTEKQYPGLKIITKPLNPSKIYDAVACLFGDHRSESDTSEGELCKDFKGCHLLVAEDNSINQALISVLLTELGATFELAKNGVEAIEKFSATSYDLVLMDVNMPEMDGITATAEILAYEQQNDLVHVPIVALTAHALKGDRQRMLDAGMDNYLAKPIDRAKLISILSHYLSKPTET